MPTPVVTVASGGLAVRDVTGTGRGLPVTEATRGTAVTYVASGGLPVTQVVNDLLPSGGGGPPLATLDGATFNVTMSGGNLIATHNSNAGNSGVRSTALKSSGKFYFEAKAGSQIYAFGQYAGILLSTGSFPDLATGANCAMTTYQGAVFASGVGTGKSIGVIAIGDIIGVAIDLSGLAWFRKNGGNWNGIGTENPATGVGGVAFTVGSYAPALGFNGSTGDNASINCGQTAFAFAAPAGFVGWPA